MDYSHPRYYIIIGIVSILITILIGFNLQKGFYIAVLGMTVFTFIYYYAKDEYDRTERQVLVELVLSFLGFIFLPVAYLLGFADSLIPNALDFLFFFIGFSSITISTSILYLLEPENEKQLVWTLAFAIFIQVVIMVLVKIMSSGGYLP